MIAIIEKYPSGIDYSNYFDFDFTNLYLCETEVKKILKKDVTLNIAEQEYKYLILVGAEPCKFIGKINSVMTHQGLLLEEKYIPLANPKMLKIAPQNTKDFNRAVSNIKSIVSGTTNEAELDLKGITLKEEAKKYLEYILANADRVAMDTETTALYCRKGYVLGISLSHKEKQGVYILSDIIDSEIETLLQRVAYEKQIIFHNAKFDIQMLQYHFNLKFKDFDDTMLMHYILDENNPHGLKDLAIKYTDLGDYDRELDEFKTTESRRLGIPKGKFTYDLIPFNIIYKYAATDTAATLELYNKFNGKLNDKLNWVYKNILIEGAKFLIQMEGNGVPFSKDKLLESINKIDSKIKDLKTELYSFEEVSKYESDNGLLNPGSVKQLRELFFKYIGLNPTGIKTGKGEDSLNAEALEILADTHPIPKFVLDIRKLEKIKSTYLDKILINLDRDNRLRTGFNLHTTTSGRLSSSGTLNMQQLPRDDKTVKKCIVAKEGHKIVSLDLSTAEMYFASVLSKDKVLQQIFIDKIDYHGAMACLKYGLNCDPNEVKSLYPDIRNSAKTVSFEILYKLNYNEEALEKFKTLKRWLKKQEKFIKENGFIYSFFGRKRRVPEVKSSDRKVIMHAIRSAINFLVQSVSSDVNLLAAIKMQKFIVKNNMNAKIFALVHDSILAEVPDEEIDLYSSKLTEFIENSELSIPNCPIGVDIEIGQNYAFA